LTATIRQARDRARDRAARGLLLEASMSDQPPKPAESPPAAAKTSKLVLILLVLNLGASGFGTFKAVTAKPAEGPAHEAAPPPTTTEVVGPVFAMDPFVVNLDEPGTSRYLKVTIQLELINAEAEVTINKSKQLLRDTILSHLSGLHLVDTLGAAAKDKLRGEMVAKIEKILGPNKVRRLFFQEFVVQ
jgi:flagellar protein FliL